MSDWTALQPDRFAYETKEMEALGFLLDEQERRSTGRVVFLGEIDWRGDVVELKVVYPDAFPYFRPEVFAPTLKLGRHQNPYESNLCLLDRSTRAWDTDDTGAWLVSKQVPYLLGLLEDDDRMAAEEAPQGEPMSWYFGRQPGTAVVIPEAMLALAHDVAGGTATIAVGKDEQPEQLLRGCLRRVCTTGHKKTERQLAAAEGALARRFPKNALALTWVRLPELPQDGNTPQHLLNAAMAAPGFREPPWASVSGGKISVLGIVVEEEIRQRQLGDAWLFVVRLEIGAQQHQYTTRGYRFGAGPPPLRWTRFD